MATFNILKRNRKYFSATKDGYKCKILIDENSEGLELGDNQELAVVDISVRSSYGTDVIYKLPQSAEVQKNAGICSLRSDRYNWIMVKECHRLGGRWIAEEKSWIFPDFVEDEVEILDEKYNSPLIAVEIKFPEGAAEFNASIYVAGYCIATACGRDSGAEIAPDVAFITGCADSGGSVKNWKTVITENAVIRMRIPELCLEDIDYPYSKI